MALKCTECLQGYIYFKDNSKDLECQECGAFWSFKYGSVAP